MQHEPGDPRVVIHRAGRIRVGTAENIPSCEQITRGADAKKPRDRRSGGGEEAPRGNDFGSSSVRDRFAAESVARLGTARIIYNNCPRNLRCGTTHAAERRIMWVLPDGGNNYTSSL